MGKRGVGFYWKLAFTNLKGNRRVYLPYLLSSVGIIMMFYSINALGQGIDQGALYGGTTVASMMGLGVFVIGLFAVLFLFYTNSFIIKRRKKELGLYNILGMEKRHIAHILFRETLLTAVCSLALGLGLGIVFSRVLFWLLGLLLGTDLAVAFVIPVSAITSTLGLFGIIFLLTLCYNLLQVKLSKPIELLHGGETGEREPKAHWFLAVLGALLLGTGYTMAVTIQDPLSALVFFFVAVILVILGTYLLFITGITAMLKLLKKNKRFYYKTNHFTAISGMLFRMKQNAAGLASICVLFTALLVTVSTTFSLYTSMDGLLRARYPRNVLVSVCDANQEAKDMVRSAVNQKSQELGLALENVVDREGWNITTARVGNTLHTQEVSLETCAVVNIFTQSEFERFSGQQVDLAENQVLLFDPANTFPEEDTLHIDDKTYQIVPSDYVMPEASTLAQIYEMYYLVVRDETVVENILAPSGSDTFPIYSYDFDVAGGDPEDIAALREALGTVDFSGPGVEYEALLFEDSATSRQSFMELYGGLFFLGLFLGVLFLLGTALIIYYKQVSEGYDDARRFNIMQKVGMSHREVKQSIHSQILLVFFLPLVTAVLHLAFAFPMLQKILLVMGLNNFPLILCSTLGCVGVFAVAYLVIYALTARTYYNIVESAS
ncbi:ABC transporter permease [Acutalibacter sp. LFL-21]|uniref:FtsX-like permease family protein n=1 Tax=Acutalibacter sp. LFL-21 TaxID=2983399 RepID=UPI0021D68F3C|nr:ABC transporter permease [Acutalibacter sp. LFL-21]MCU7652219.1 ABC transporter permease [Acutalibacter sp. LFL-21]